MALAPFKCPWQTLRAQWNLFKSPSSLLFSTVEPGKWKAISLAAGYGHVIYLDQQVEGWSSGEGPVFLFPKKKIRREESCYLHYPFFFLLEMWIWCLECNSHFEDSVHKQLTIQRENSRLLANLVTTSSALSGLLWEFLLSEKHAPYLFKPLFVSFTVTACACPPNWFEMHIKSGIKQEQQHQTSAQQPYVASSWTALLSLFPSSHKVP